MAKPRSVGVLGGGLWGTALAHHVSRPGRKVVLWEIHGPAAEQLRRSRRHAHMPGFRLDDEVEVTSELSRAAACELLLFVVPSQFSRATASAVRPLLGGRKPWIVNASKGIEPKTLLTEGQVLESELPGCRVWTLSGPSFAREVALGVPTRMVLAGPRAGSGDILPLFDAGSIRVVWSPDRRGVELGGSLKNVLAIGAGIVDGMDIGNNTRAALLTEAMAEMALVIRRCGGKAESAYGLAGLGDLVLTGTGQLSRNHAFGVKLGQGLTPAEARRRIATVVEGIEAADSARALARRNRVPAPLIEAIWAIVRRGAPARRLIQALGFPNGKER